MKEEDQKMEVETETKIPSVPFDQDIKKAAPGPDNFRRFRAGLDDLKEKLKELKSQEKVARKSKDPEVIEKCKALREQYEEAMEDEQMKAIVLTLKETH